MSKVLRARRRRRVAVMGAMILVLAVCLTGPRANEVAVVLVDVAEQAGLTRLNIHGDETKDYVVDADGNGAAWFDYDRDGHLDALLVNGSTRDRIRQGGHPMVALYRNDGRGRFTDVTAGSGLETRGWGMGVCVADFDNDGFQDVYVTAFGPNALFRNNGDGTFTDVTGTAGVGDARWSTGCAFGDYDRDGYVDLYVANHLTFDEGTIPGRGAGICKFEDLDIYCGPRGLPGEADRLYRNNGDGTFTDATEAAGITAPAYFGFGVLFSDLDGDGWPDIYVANDSVPNVLYRNNGDGTFSEMGLVSGAALGASGLEQAGMGVDAGDYNGNGRQNLIVTNFADDYNTLYENGERMLFTDRTHQAGLAIPTRQRLGWGVGFVDADNDGLLDLFVANGHVYPDVDTLKRGMTYRQRNQLFRNLGGGRFRDISDAAGSGLQIARSSRGAAFGDYDNDGRIDVLVIDMNDRPTLLRNETVSRHRWVTLRLVGTESNRDGIGARIQVAAGGRTHTREVRAGGSYLSHNDTRAHVGLGNADRVDQVEIRWPSGAVDTIAGLDVDRMYVVREGTGRADAEPGGPR